MHQNAVGEESLWSLASKGETPTRRGLCTERRPHDVALLTFGLCGAHIGQVVPKGEGAIHMFRKGNTAFAYTWENGQWVEQGEVVGAKQEKKKGPDGKMYDQIVDLDVDSGPMQLGFNYTDNPFDVAHAFCEKVRAARWGAVRSGAEPRRPSCVATAMPRQPGPELSRTLGVGHMMCGRIL